MEVPHLLKKTAKKLDQLSQKLKKKSAPLSFLIIHTGNVCGGKQKNKGPNKNQYLGLQERKSYFL